ncbi:hypothetical protein NIES267_55060 [Calothrix parasitica NIES-267]|uniref:Uncharacterized protein n=1 Tax=Calothrix parasitica NIES-267 TaxID=1973488 RepID=A0A1Z4LXU2_9CYAN|nr:hypothetical protein NIES267_55060 [Calothrix parasitica NIES-267]
MGTMNAKVDSRPKQEKYDADAHPGREENAGSKSESSRGEYERIGGTDSSGRLLFGDGCAITGGIIRQLIDEYKNQVANKNEQKSQIEAEIVQLNSRIQEFNSLLEELEANKTT